MEEKEHLEIFSSNEICLNYMRFIYIRGFGFPINSLFSKFSTLRFLRIFLYISIFLSFSIPNWAGLHSQTKKQSNGIVWQTSILKAMELAKEQDKPIFVELYAEWCNYCKTLEREVFPDKEVSKALSKFVTVRLNGEEYPNFMQRYEARGYPTLLFLDKYSNFIAKLPGMPTKEMVIREANQAFANSNIEEKLLANFKKDPNSLRNHFELGIYYYQSENYSKSAQYFQKTTELKGSGDSGEDDLKRQSLYNLALIQMNQGNYTLAVSTWNKYIVKYKNNDSLASAYLHRGIAWRERKDNNKARADLLKAQSISKIPEELEMIQEEISSLK